MSARLALARTPTPLHRLDRLSAEVGAEIWCKRDDLTGAALSGNKVRKLERLLHGAVAAGADTILTTGGLQSNHARATAIAARQLGMAPVLLLRTEDGGAPETVEGNLLLDHLVGATVHYCTPEAYRTSRQAILLDMAASLAKGGAKPYIIPEGGSNGLGAMAYVDAMSELRGQTQHAGLYDPFDGVVCAVGSGGTLAGIALGEPVGPVFGVAVCDDRATFVPRVQAIAAEARAHGAGPLGDHWNVVDGYQGPAYAVATPEIWATIRKVAVLEGLLLDPVYTGKAMHALLSEIDAGRWRGRWLFWHTGGLFGLFGRGKEIVNL